MVTQAVGLELLTIYAGGQYYSAKISVVLGAEIFTHHLRDRTTLRSVRCLSCVYSTYRPRLE
jgi:hypothetical protein